jgi:hypothetical protein
MRERVQEMGGRIENSKLTWQRNKDNGDFAERRNLSADAALEASSEKWKPGTPHDYLISSDAAAGSPVPSSQGHYWEGYSL